MAVADKGKVADKKSGFKKSIQDDVKRDKLGDMLRKAGRITGRQLKNAEDIQKKQPIWIGHILIRLGYVTEDAIINYIVRNMGIAQTDWKSVKPTEDALKLVQYEDAKQFSLIPVETDGTSITLSMLDPTNFKGVEFVAASTKLSVKTQVTSLKELAEAYKAHYKIKDDEYKTLFPVEEEEEKPGKKVEEKEVTFDMGDIIDQAGEELDILSTDEEEDDGGMSANDAGIVKLVNGLLVKSAKTGSSDIHIEPYEKKYRVRYRKDGTLSEDMILPLQMRNAIVSRIKIMAGLNIAEKRVPQDGRIKIRISKSKVVDFRVSVLPTLFGESIVMRLLDPGGLQIDLTKLGFSQNSLAVFNRAIRKPQGLLLVTGPTGSGKTNTLYSAINSLNTEDVKILTAEDPVEFNFEGINQVLVRNEVGLTFGAALKAFLRQDPEIILVGEIRDLETAEIALKASITGHIVFSTLHTNDCPSTVARLIDIGIKSYMVATALLAIIAQRLFRRICGKCKTEIKMPPPQELLDAGFLKEELPSLKLHKGEGCPHCNKGYKGRVGVFEVMESSEQIVQAITAAVPEEQLRKIAIKDGMITLRRDGLEKARDGVTTLDECYLRTILQKEALPAYLLNPDELIFEDGDLIIREGNTDKNFYQLLQGALTIIKNGRIVGEITQPNDYFGEMSALMNQPRTATIKSKGKSIVKVFPGDKLEETIKNYPDIALKVIKSLLVRLNETDKLVSRGSPRAQSR